MLPPHDRDRLSLYLLAAGLLAVALLGICYGGVALSDWLEAKGV